MAILSFMSCWKPLVLLDEGSITSKMFKIAALSEIKITIHNKYPPKQNCQDKDFIINRM